nr:GxxExxY protein [uncultured Holophaga sp.]
MPLPYESLTSLILESAAEVHAGLGPGYQAPVYEAALFLALRERGLRVEKQALIQVFYRDHLVGTHVVDLLVSGEIALAIRIEGPLNEQQINRTLNHLKASRKPVGICLDFGGPKLEWRRLFNRPGPDPGDGI